MHNSPSNSLRMRNLSSPGRAAGRCLGWAGRGALAAAAMLALVVGGCESTGGSGGSGSGGGGGQGAQTAPPVAHDGWAKLGYRLDWQGFASVPGGNRVTQFEIGSDVLLVQESGSRVTLLEKSDGSLRWTNQLSSRLTKYVGADIIRDMVFVSSDSELTGLEMGTGNVVLRQPFQRVVNTPPMISGAVAVYGTASGEVMGHMMTNGVKLWGFQTPGAITRGAVDVNGIAGVVSQSGDVLFLDPQSGVLYGRQRMFRGSESAPISGDGAMYVASLDQSLWAFEPSGRVRWRLRTEHALTAQPTFHAGAVYCEVPTMGLVAVDAGTGAKRWASPDARGVVVADRNGMLVVHGGGTMMLVDPADGQVVARESIPGVTMVVAEEFVDGALYAVSSGGAVSRMVPRR